MVFAFSLVHCDMRWLMERSSGRILGLATLRPWRMAGVREGELDGLGERRDRMGEGWAGEEEDFEEFGGALAVSAAIALDSAILLL
jgi:hypothetical protein